MLLRLDSVAFDPVLGENANQLFFHLLLSLPDSGRQGVAGSLCVINNANPPPQMPKKAANVGYNWEEGSRSWELQVKWL